MRPWRHAIGKILIHGFPSISFLIVETLFLQSLLDIRRLSYVANFSFTKPFPKIISILIFRKLFRKMSSSLIFAKVISQDVVEHNFYEICSVKRFSSFGCTRAVTRLIIATKLSQKFFSYP